MQQFHNGVPIWGSELVRDLENGQAMAVFGSLAQGQLPSAEARLTPAEAGERLVGGPSARARLLDTPVLVILISPTGSAQLSYTATVAGDGVDQVFVDANTGEELDRITKLHTQQAVGLGKGVLGDTKKLSIDTSTGTFLAFDRHRPPIIETFDLRANLSRAKSLLFGTAVPTTADLASDADNVWTDPAVVDGHVHISWTYDYYYKRFGRTGLDGKNAPIDVLVNLTSQQSALAVSQSDFSQYVINAFWCEAPCGPLGRGAIAFGSGFPANFVLNGQNWTYLSGSLDAAAHELTHAVTSSTSKLIYQNESGALNEAFSDMMGKSVEFFYHSPGSAAGQADYVIGKDVVRGLSAGAINGIRSMANPSLFGDPDHYSKRYLGSGDSGGVHTNSAIPNQVFFLAIEGGTNRTSGQSVVGVGSGSREQIERVFFRAFTVLLPASANFSTARAATIQAARDLYGIGSNAARAVTQAWSAVGVS